MASSMSLEEKFEALMRNFEEVRSQNEYLKKQLAKSMSNQRKSLRSTPSHKSSESEHNREEGDSNPFASSSDEDRPRARRNQRNSNPSLDFRVEIPEFEGRLDPDEFLEWLQTVERVFEYKDVPEDKKVKLVALKLRKYASLWWENLIKKRAKRGKTKVRSWEKMRTKLKDRFLPPSYLQDNYSKLHNLQQGSLVLKNTQGSLRNS